MKRRIVLILIILCVLGLISGGVYWYLQTRSPSKLYSRADVAMKVGKYEKAETLAGRYIAAYPDDWNGYYLLAEVYSRQGRYEEAREQLEELQAKEPSLKPDMYLVLTRLAETYAFPAREFLNVAEATTPISKLQEAIEKMRKGNEILAGIPTDRQDRALEIQQGIAMNKTFMGDFLRLIANRYMSAAEIADAAGEVELSQERRKQYAVVLQEAKQETRDAIRLYLTVVSQDPSRFIAARNVVQLCTMPDNREFLAEARKAILEAEGANPVAKMLLIMNELHVGKDEIAPPQSEILRVAQELDELLRQYPDEELILLRRAQLALSLSDFATVERFIATLFEGNPQHRDARLLEARLMQARGQTEEAERKLFSLKAEDPRWIEAHLAFAKAVDAAGKEERARAAMRRVTELDPTNAIALRFLTESLLRKGFFKEASVDAQSYYDAYPDDPDALRLYVESTIGMNQLDKVRKTLDQAKAEYASDASLLYETAMGYKKIGDRENMLAAARLAAESTPNGLRGKLSVSRAMSLLGRTDEAETLLREGIISAPEYPELHYALGRVYEQTGKNVQAIEQFHQAVRLDPVHDRYRLELAKAYFNIGDIDECKNVLDKVSPTHAGAGVMRLQIKLIQGEPISSEEALEQTSGAGGLAVAMACLKAGDPNQCIAICNSELAKKPDDIHVRDILGQAYLALGQTDQCYEQWEMLLEVSPGQLVNYLRLARLLARDHTVPEVVHQLASIPNARPALIELAKGWLFIRIGKPSSALEVYKKLSGQPEVDMTIRNQARLAMAKILGQQHRWKEAIDILDQVGGNGILQNRSDLLKARLLIADQKWPQVKALLETLRADAKQQSHAVVLQRVAELYIAIQQYDEALAVCDDMEELFPKDPDTYLLRAWVLTILDRQAEAIQSYRKAIQCQPGRLGIYSKLARVLDHWQRPLEALSVLDELESLSDAGRLMALMDRGVVFNRWGLYAQAMDCYKQLAASRHGNNPKIQLYLGQALARIGQTNKARQILKNIPEYSDEYTQAQRLLIDLTEEVREKLTILHRLEANRSDPADILRTKMKILMDAGRADESLRSFQSFLNEYPETQSMPAELHSLVLQAVSYAEDREAAIGLVRDLTRRQVHPVWTYITILLTADTQPEVAAALLPEDIHKSGLYDTLLGVYLARHTGDSQAAQTWYDRFTHIDTQAGGQEPAKRIPSSYKILVHLAMGATSQARAELESFRSDKIIDTSVADELIDYVEANDESGQAEALELLKASVALDLSMPKLSQSWAWNLLKRRPSNQWAASLIQASGIDEATLRQVRDILKPKDCILARAIEAEHLMQTKQFTEAAALYGRLARQEKGQTSFLFLQGTALENAGQFVEALDIYRRIWKSTGNPIAANNAAYLVSELAVQDEKQLAEAGHWIDQAVNASPGVWAFQDTLGWIRFLQGHHDEASKRLRRVVKELPDSLEVHYHLGAVESARKNTQLARWHLDAAIQIGRIRQAENKELTPAEAKAVERAQDIITNIEPIS